MMKKIIPFLALFSALVSTLPLFAVNYFPTQIRIDDAGLMRLSAEKGYFNADSYEDFLYVSYGPMNMVDYYGWLMHFGDPQKWFYLNPNLLLEQIPALTKALPFQLNGDGLDDVLILSGGTGEFWVAKNNGDETFAVQKFPNPAIQISEGPFDLVALDANADGLDEFIGLLKTNPNNLLIYKNDGMDNFALQQTVNLANSTAVHVLDIVGDANEEWVITQGATLLIYQINAMGNFVHVLASDISVPNATASKIVGQGDLDGDGDPDLLVSDGDKTLYPFLRNGDSYLAGTSMTVEKASVGQLLDANRDDRLDFVTAGVTQAQLFLGDGTAHFTKVNDANLLKYTYDGLIKKDDSILVGNFCHNNSVNDVFSFRSHAMTDVASDNYLFCANTPPKLEAVQATGGNRVQLTYRDFANELPGSNGAYLKLKFEGSEYNFTEANVADIQADDTDGKLYEVALPVQTAGTYDLLITANDGTYDAVPLSVSLGLSPSTGNNGGGSGGGCAMGTDGPRGFWGWLLYVITFGWLRRKKKLKESHFSQGIVIATAFPNGFSREADEALRRKGEEESRKMKEAMMAKINAQNATLSTTNPPIQNTAKPTGFDADEMDKTGIGIPMYAPVKSENEEKDAT